MPEKLRIFHFDMNFVNLKPSYIKKWVRKLSEFGYNAILWELEDKVQWETCPECVWPEAMSKDQFREILAYSESLGLQSIPLLQIFGHGEYVMLHKEYFHFREQPDFHDCYCTSNPEVRKFFKKWISEYLDLFGDIKYFHLGGDEAYRFATCPKCKKRTEKVGENQFYVEHLQEISKEIFKKGCRPGVWGDMILHHPEQVDCFPKDFLIWDWNYWAGLPPYDNVRVWGRGSMTADQIGRDLEEKLPGIKNEDGEVNGFYTAQILKDRGYDVILCSASRSNGDSVFCGINNTHSKNVVGASNTVSELELVGHCVTSWAIRINNNETQTTSIKLAALADENPKKCFEDLRLDCSEQLFGIRSVEFFDVMDKIGKGFIFSNGSSFGIQWCHGLKDSLLPPEGLIKNNLLSITENKDITIDEHKANLKETGVQISEGLKRLEEFALKVTSGFEIIDSWRIGAAFQLKRLRSSQELMNSITDGITVSLEDFIESLKKTKEQYRNFAETWMTPQSAERNSKLIYDAIEDYFSELNK